ncbi:MAG: 7-carboxy-7-deazaguanine synthase QueE [Kiritimatiellales bacterium]|nr:7-carboxy-7-deazaguanine synthase QueE [Kiritimatiellales bacterium]
MTDFNTPLLRHSTLPSVGLYWYASRLNLESRLYMGKPDNLTAFVSEIFSSAQGEGVNIGRRQLFVRFAECHRNCLYCDTPVERTEFAAIEREPGSGQFEQIANPLSPQALLDLLGGMNRPEFAHDDLFITGGEPLLQADFLTEFLPKALKLLNLPVHLETSGDLPEPFEKTVEWVDHVLMDIKLPSVTGEPEAWEMHRAFLDIIEREDAGATIKLVVSADTSDADLSHAAEIIRDSGTLASVVLQPMTAASKTDRVPSAKQVLTWQSQMAVALGRSVRVIPQSHKLMGLL